LDNDKDQEKELYVDKYHPICSQEIRNQQISIILIPPARPLLMTSKGKKGACEWLP